MRQHPDDFHHEDPGRDDDDEEGLEELGMPVYQGSGLSVRALTAEELQRFLDAHHGQPAELLGSGWAALDPPRHPLGVPRTPPAATQPVVPAGPVAGSLGSPGRSALAQYRRRRATELAGWTRSLAWRAPLVAAAGAVGQVLAAQAGLPQAGLAGLVVAALVGWRLRFRPSEQAAPGSAAAPGSGTPPACSEGRNRSRQPTSTATAKPSRLACGSPAWAASTWAARPAAATSGARQARLRVQPANSVAQRRR